ncbi:MAG: hypothetical protein RL648_1809 [Verrucomicrobiota bacterium]|jgi:polyhydroxyalkanoate synthesis regulator phasin
MIETVKQTFRAGLGATVITAEKMEAALQDLVKKGRLSAEEAREAARKISEQSKAEFRETKESLETLLQDWLKKAPIVAKSDHLHLQQRVAHLEARLTKLESESREEFPRE